MSFLLYIYIALLTGFVAYCAVAGKKAIQHFWKTDEDIRKNLLRTLTLLRETNKDVEELKYLRNYDSLQKEDAVTLGEEMKNAPSPEINKQISEWEIDGGKTLDWEETK